MVPARPLIGISLCTAAMPYENTIATVESALRGTFADVDRWFDFPEELRRFAPASGGWTVDQVLEHITLTNHFLMLTLRKFTATALRRAGRAQVPDGDSDLERLRVIGERGTFGWQRPAHMEPAGRPPAEVRATMTAQLGECLDLLRELGRGEGSLCRVTMTVNDLGKIDLYQWLYFIAQHARRHLQQLAAIEKEYQAAAVSGA